MKKRAETLKPTAVGQNREIGRGDWTSSSWHSDSGTDGHEGPYGVESKSKRSLGIVYLHERTSVLSCECKCESMQFSVPYVYLWIVYLVQYKYAILCVFMCEENKLLFGQFTGPNITTTMGPTDPQHEWLVCRRRAKYTTLLTSIGQQWYTTMHGPPTWHSSIHEHINTNTRHEHGPVGPVWAAIKTKM